MRSLSAGQAIDQNYESQYNLRVRHPERGQIYTRYAQASELTRQRPEARLDLRFGDKPSSTLDLFVPRSNEAPPLLIFIHGGYWRALDKHGFSFVADAYLESGIAVALPTIHWRHWLVFEKSFKRSVRLCPGWLRMAKSLAMTRGALWYRGIRRVAIWPQRRLAVGMSPSLRGVCWDMSGSVACSTWLPCCRHRSILIWA